MRLAIAIIGLLACLPVEQGRAEDTCAHLALPKSQSHLGQRDITADDLIRLRDLGSAGSAAREAFIAMSPDRTRVAFQLRQADADTNSYCLGMFVLNLQPGARPLQVDSGGQYMVATFGGMGFAHSIPPGMPQAIQPKWSPDGLWIAYLRRDNDTTQVWRARVDGKGAHKLTAAAFDVEGFAWRLDGSGMVFSGRPKLALAQAELEDEGKSGFVYDERFIPASSNRPYIRGGFEVAYYSVDLSGNRISAATPAEQALLEPVAGQRGLEAATRAVANAAADIAWSTPADRANIYSQDQLRVRTAKGRDFVCAHPECTGIVDLWWSGDGATVIFQTRPWARSATRLLVWEPGADAPRLILETDDVLAGCEMAEVALVCAHEAALQPRRLVRISLATGRMDALFDPNPEFASLRLGAVERLRWRNSFGIETWGDLVLPPNHVPGQTHPLIVTQYVSRGFLRGAVGDAYPIQLFARHGFAVLSVNGPPSIASLRGASSSVEAGQANQADWADRRSNLSTVETGVKLVIDRGLADPKRVGITGLSDGASTVQFAVVNSNMFAAAALSGCCQEEARFTGLLGPFVAQYYLDAGFPRLDAPGEAFWAPMSIIMNARSIGTPLLMQLSDNEYLGAVESYEALRQQKKPVAMYVFPNEYHIRWQPAHRRAGYIRTLEWFDYWLNGKKALGPGKASQYQRWDALRAS